MAISNHDRVGRAIALLGEGLAGFVARECRARFGDGWAAGVQRVNARGVGRPRPVNLKDPQFLLKVMWDEWNAIFSKKLSHTDRSYVSELREARNAWAHNNAFTTDDALRVLDTVKRLLESTGAGEQAIEADRLHQQLLRRKFDRQAEAFAKKAAAPAVGGSSVRLSGLPGWRDVVTPHEDVATGSFQVAEFAADLHKVWRDDAVAEYGDPVEFFRRTYITEGLASLIVGAARRFDRSGGDPVIQLQTNFGGGKTHALIALYHLASGTPVTRLKGVEELLAERGLGLPDGPVRRAVLVGHQLQPGVAATKSDGTVVRTMWGELAYQLGGAQGYALVAEADRTGTSPGEALIDLLRSCAPCLILIDEWVGYARQLYGIPDLPAGSFDAHFSFAQALTDAAASTAGALLVATIPSSQIEVGGEGGQAALTRLENLFARTQANWRTATAEESFEIVRRRLFTEVSPEAARRRDAVLGAFAKLYQRQRADFPVECREGDYLRRMKATYPIHPELFDRLFGEWSELERFQRTRGVLRFMASVIHQLWIGSDPNLLIMPGTLPVDDHEVCEELLRYLNPAWRTVVEKDVEGTEALPLRMDKSNPNFGRSRAARKVARTVYFGTAPSQHAANRGLDERSVKLGCTQPDDGAGPATYQDALRRLSDLATYLYRDSTRYWYSISPTVNRMARDPRREQLRRHPGRRRDPHPCGEAAERPGWFPRGAPMRTTPRGGAGSRRGPSRGARPDRTPRHQNRRQRSRGPRQADPGRTLRRHPPASQHAGIPRRRHRPSERSAPSSPRLPRLAIDPPRHQHHGTRNSGTRQIPRESGRQQTRRRERSNRSPHRRNLHMGHVPLTTAQRPHRRHPLEQNPPDLIDAAGRACLPQTLSRRRDHRRLRRIPATRPARQCTAMARRLRQRWQQRQDRQRQRQRQDDGKTGDGSDGDGKTGSDGSDKTGDGDGSGDGSDGSDKTDSDDGDSGSYGRERMEVSVRQLWDDFTRYLYLPRLREPQRPRERRQARSGRHRLASRRFRLRRRPQR